MKHIFLNLKRFDIPKELGGVNSIAPINKWANYIVSNTEKKIKVYSKEDVEFVIFLPEAHLIEAVNSLEKDSPIKIGSQSVFREDTQIGGNFGAFTSNITANAVKAMGCKSTLIGHFEERKDKMGILQEAEVTDTKAVNRLLNKQIKQAIKAGLSVVYCVGENSEEQERWKDVLKEQIEIGLKGVDTSKVTIAYEPIWAIGPGKTPPDDAYIRKIASYIKEIANNIDVVYGGGLKTDNAKMISSIDEIDGGLIALTRFSGDIGFYPEEYLEIIKIYLGK